jgi:hypothetical protein
MFIIDLVKIFNVFMCRTIVWITANLFLKSVSPGAWLNSYQSVPELSTNHCYRGLPFMFLHACFCQPFFMVIPPLMSWQWPYYCYHIPFNVSLNARILKGQYHEIFRLLVLIDTSRNDFVLLYINIREVIHNRNWLPADEYTRELIIPNPDGWGHIWLPKLWIDTTQNGLK